MGKTHKRMKMIFHIYTTRRQCNNARAFRKSSLTFAYLKRGRVHCSSLTVDLIKTRAESYAPRGHMYLLHKQNIQRVAANKYTTALRPGTEQISYSVSEERNSTTLNTCYLHTAHNVYVHVFASKYLLVLL